MCIKQFYLDFVLINVAESTTTDCGVHCVVTLLLTRRITYQLMYFKTDTTRQGNDHDRIAQNGKN